MNTRRHFLKQSVAASTGVFYIAKTSWAQKSPGDTINMAIIGFGGRSLDHPLTVVAVRRHEHGLQVEGDQPGVVEASSNVGRHGVGPRRRVEPDSTGLPTGVGARRDEVGGSGLGADPCGEGEQSISSRHDVTIDR